MILPDAQKLLLVGFYNKLHRRWKLIIRIDVHISSIHALSMSGFLKLPLRFFFEDFIYLFETERA